MELSGLMDDHAAQGEAGHGRTYALTILILVTLSLWRQSSRAVCRPGR